MSKNIDNEFTNIKDCKTNDNNSKISLDNSEKKKEVYSIRITTRQKNLIRNNKEIKDDLDKYVISYLKSFL